MLTVNVHKFRHHEELKDEILQMIEERPDPAIDASDKISKSDWDPDKAGIYTNKKYQQRLLPLLTEHCQTAYKRATGFWLNEMWYQQYSTGDSHDWHVHEFCHWTNVYFLELPHKDERTQVCDLDRNPIEYEAEEGDIIFFPSMWLHRSAPLTKGRKTIISFNTNFTHDRRYNPS